MSRKLTIWRYFYMWIDDPTWNKGYTEMPGSFVGTKEDFKQYVHDEETGYGFSYHLIRRRHATKEEIEDYQQELVVYTGW